MWVITVYVDDCIKMYEYEDELEAKESMKKLKGSRFLSHIIYFNDPVLNV